MIGWLILTACQRLAYNSIYIFCLVFSYGFLNKVDLGVMAMKGYSASRSLMSYSEH